MLLQIKKKAKLQLSYIIHVLHSDLRGEYQKLTSSLSNVSIVHHVSCPHNHEQNNLVERKHKHIVELTMTMLYHASLHLDF